MKREYKKRYRIVSKQKAEILVRKHKYLNVNRKDLQQLHVIKPQKTQTIQTKKEILEPKDIINQGVINFCFCLFSWFAYGVWVLET